MYRVHLIAPFHAVPSDEHSHCAFSGKAKRFAKMMKGRAEVIEYSNEGSESEAAEHVVMLTRDELARVCPKGEAEFEGKYAVRGSECHKMFSYRMKRELGTRLRRGDVIGHTFDGHQELPKLFPRYAHLETGVGYGSEPTGAYRVFESEAWRHWHWGRWDQSHAGDAGMNRDYSWVIPNYFDLEDWPEGDGAGEYVLYLGRLDRNKGAGVALDIAKAWKIRHPGHQLMFVFAGQGDWSEFRDAAGDARDIVQYAGVVKGRMRAPLVGSAAALLSPTRFIEPFGGAAVEGMLTGTPCVVSDYGAYTETVIHGHTGWRCKVLDDFVTGLERARDLDRRYVAAYARSRYSLEACAPQYERALRDIAGDGCGVFSGVGWYADRGGARTSPAGFCEARAPSAGSGP